jgi:4-hydroxy-tetrahydrodipicolinate synthase
MKPGFYPALGTPLDEMGNLVAASLARHVEDQIQGGASGLLVMGSMGIQAQVKNSEYVKTARVAVEAANGACPVMVGVMDNAVARVLDRIDSLRGLDISGVVATTPYYFAMSQAEVIRFFERVADASPFPVYMYDLPSVTQTKIAADTCLRLMAHPNIAGIKTGNLETARRIERAKHAVDPDFVVLFSGLDVFDAAYGYGLTRQLDGMFACTTPINARLYDSLAAGDRRAASEALDRILLLRDTFMRVGVFAGFSYAMNALGFPGNFAPDYTPPLSAEQQDEVRQCLKQLKLI